MVVRQKHKFYKLFYILLLSLLGISHQPFFILIGKFQAIIYIFITRLFLRKVESRQTQMHLFLRPVNIVQQYGSIHALTNTITIIPYSLSLS